MFEMDSGKDKLSPSREIDLLQHRHSSTDLV